MSRHALLWLGLTAALVGCQPRQALQPHLLAEHDFDTTIALASPAGGPDEAAWLAVSPAGQTRWIAAGQPGPAGPRLPERVNLVTAIDVDGDGIDEIVGAGGSFGLVAVGQDGSEIWQAPLPPAPLFGLVTAPLGPAGEPVVLVAGSTPVGLRAYDRTGQPVWPEPVGRVAVAVAVQGSGPEAVIYASDDSGGIATYSAAGEPLARLQVGILATHLSLHGDGLLALGSKLDDPPTLATLVALDLDGTVRWECPTGDLPAPGSQVIAVDDFAGDGQPVVLVIDAANRVHWVRDGKSLAQGPELPLGVFTVCSGPATPGGSRAAWLGSARGLYLVSLVD